MLQHWGPEVYGCPPRLTPPPAHALLHPVTCSGSLARWHRVCVQHPSTPRELASRRGTSYKRRQLCLQLLPAAGASGLSCPASLTRGWGKHNHLLLKLMWLQRRYKCLHSDVSGGSRQHGQAAACTGAARGTRACQEQDGVMLSTRVASLGSGSARTARSAQRVQHGRAGGPTVLGVQAEVGRSCNLVFNGAKGDRQGGSSRLSNRICSAALRKQS